MTKGEVKKMMKDDPRIVEVREYSEGFVANAYRWPAPRTGVRWSMTPDGLERYEFQYDAKRRHGRGPSWVAFSERGGRLASG